MSSPMMDWCYEVVVLSVSYMSTILSYFVVYMKAVMILYYNSSFEYFVKDKLWKDNANTLK